MKNSSCSGVLMSSKMFPNGLPVQIKSPETGKQQPILLWS